jgi:hypothetical protein
MGCMSTPHLSCHDAFVSQWCRLWALIVPPPEAGQAHGAISKQCPNGHKVPHAVQVDQEAKDASNAPCQQYSQPGSTSGVQISDTLGDEARTGHGDKDAGLAKDGSVV